MHISGSSWIVLEKSLSKCLGERDFDAAPPPVDVFPYRSSLLFEDMVNMAIVDAVFSPYMVTGMEICE